jgi:transcriptional regulator with PAS, ATPase and Fis domain
MKGYIKLHRRIMDWEWYKDSNTKNIFIHLLLNACYDSCRFMGQSVDRGEYITSLSRISNDLNIPIRQVRTSIKRLKQTGEIDTLTTNKYTKVTICNYESYQVEETKTKKKTTRKRQASDTQTTDINKNIIKKEDKNNIFLKECLSDESWKEIVCMQNKLDVEQVNSLLKNFHNHLLMTDEKKYQIRDFKSHFINWLKYNKESVAKNNGKYKWKWKGQALKTGTKEQLEKDKSFFDKPGFEFKIL